MIDGVAMDLEPRPFATFDDLHAYCYHVASAVGLCCLHIWGFRSDGGRAEALAEALRDRPPVDEHPPRRPRGRRERPDLSPPGRPRAGSASSAARPHRAERPSRPLRQLLAFEGRRAYDYYDEAEPLAGLVAPVGRPVLRAIVGIYRALLDEIARRDYDVLARRVSVPAWRKAAITARAFAGRFAPFEPRGVEAPPLR